ncbi:hypothetical protein T439DRAFT_377743 [Meredithblackwellia eburnea MCA 4105]
MEEIDPSMLYYQPEASTSAAYSISVNPADISPIPPAPVPPPPAAARASRPRRQRTKTSKASQNWDQIDDDGNYIQPKTQKIKFKIAPGSAGNSGAPGGPGDIDPTSIGWDRELDSDPDDPLCIEEQFILRVPQELAPRLREMVEKRDVPPDKVSFKFKDSRRAVFQFEGKLYAARLVDLPTLSESQKMTGASRGASVKVADVCQMLLVEEEVKDEGAVTRDRPFNIEDFIYPHGLLPPLKHVRKRRFRKRVNRRTIETVENAVEKLLEHDARADEVQYELLDNYVSDDEYGSPTGGGGVDGAESDISPEKKKGKGKKMEKIKLSFGGGGGGGGGGLSSTGVSDGDSLGAPTPLRDDFDDDEGGDGEEDGEGDADADGLGEDEEGSGYDSDLANEINKGLEALNQSDEDADDSDSDGGEGGLFGDSDEDEDDDEDDDDDDDEDATDNPETLEQKRRIKLLAEEVANLDTAIKSKEVELGKANNPIFKKRFEEMVKKMSVDRDVKKSQHALAVKELEKMQEREKDRVNQELEMSKQNLLSTTAAQPTGETSILEAGGATEEEGLGEEDDEEEEDEDSKMNED